MKRVMRIALLLAVVMLLCVQTVAADELWVQNHGALHVQVWSDTSYQDVEVTGGGFGPDVDDIDSAVMDSFAKTGSAGMWVAGPGWEPEIGKFEVAAISIPDPIWICIHADNVTRWNVLESVGRTYEWVEPEIYLITEPERQTTSFWTYYVWDWLIHSFRPR
jgi:hypothetical protein